MRSLSTLYLWLSVVTLFSEASFAQRIYFEKTVPAAPFKMEQQMRSDTEGAFHLTFDVPYIDKTASQDGFQAIDVPESEKLEELGNPEVSTIGKMIALPEGAQFSFRVTSQTQEKIENTILKPCQLNTRCDNTAQRKFFFNKELFETDELYPKSPISMEKVGELEGLTLYRVGFYPVQINSKFQQALVTHHLELTIQVKAAQGLHNTRVSRETKELLDLNTINGDFFQSVTDEPQRMLVVTAEEYKATLAPWVQWKSKKGVQVEVRSFKELGGTKEAVKEYIRKQRMKLFRKINYLLLVGNKTSLPTFTVTTSDGPTDSDYPYVVSTMTEVPKVYYGRLLANDVKEVKTQLIRWIQYENANDKGAPWYAKGTTIASSEGFNPSDKDYAKQVTSIFKAKGLTAVDQFLEGDRTATTSNLVRAFNEGRSWITYFGHGSGGSWPSTNDDFSVKDIKTVANPRKLPIVIDVACQNGSFAESCRNGNYEDMGSCFGKTWVTQEKMGQPTGAVAYYGGSVNISWHPPAIMSVGVAKAYFEKNIPTLGAATMAGQLYLIEKKGKTKETLDNLKWYHLFGDPSLTIRAKRR